MQKGKQHSMESARKRTSIFWQPKKAVSFAVAIFLSLSMFPFAAFAESGSGSANTQDSAVFTTGEPSGTENGAGNPVDTTHLPDIFNDTFVETVSIGAEPLNLIQSGGFDALEAAAVKSNYTTTVANSVPSAEDRNRIKARLNTALMNVEYQTYNNSNQWCVLDVSELKAPLSSNATAYAKALVEEVINENPDLFYAGASYGAGTGTSTTSSGKVTILTKILVQYYYPPSTISSKKSSYENAMQNMLKWVNPKSNEAEKAKAVHDWLVRNCIYNYDAYKKGGPNSYGDWSPWSAYGAVVNKKPVCEGYSLAFMAAMQRLGIQASFVTNAGHGWNRVRVDGYWYNLDITWDDPLKSGNNYADGGFNTTPSTKYFLISDAKFKKFDTTHAKWTPAGVSGTSTKYDNGWTGGVYNGNNNSTATSLSISPSSVSLADDDTVKLTLNAPNGNPALAKWTSSNTRVATVNSSGVVSSGVTAGTATITVTLDGKTAKCTVTVRKGTRLSTATVSKAPDAQQKTENKGTMTYKSSVPHQPELVVKIGGTTLKKGTDYTVTYPKDTINPGIKTATITARAGSNYSGSTTFKYTVYAPLSSVTKSPSSTINVNYTGSAQKKLPTLTFKGSNNTTLTLKEGTDFTVTWPSDMTNAGTKNVKITGRGAWTGTYSYKVVIAAPKTEGDKILAATTVNSAVKSAKNNTWVKTSRGWVYKTSGSNVVANGWKKIGGKWYYFNASGIMQTGWLKYKNKWYYLSSGGNMATGWTKAGGSWYFFVKSTGEMAANEWREGYWLNASGTWTYKHKGTWRKSSGKWWFGDSSGWYAKSCTQKIDGKNYRFDSAGWCLNP